MVYISGLFWDWILVSTIDHSPLLLSLQKGVGENFRKWIFPETEIDFTYSNFLNIATHLLLRKEARGAVIKKHSYPLIRITVLLNLPVPGKDNYSTSLADRRSYTFRVPYATARAIRISVPLPTGAPAASPMRPPTTVPPPLCSPACGWAFRLMAVEKTRKAVRQPNRSAFF